MGELPFTKEFASANRLLNIFGRIDQIFSGKLVGTATMNRRRFLKVMAAVGSSVLLAACGDEDPTPTPTPTLIPTETPTPMPTATPTEVPYDESLRRIEQTIVYENIKLFIDIQNVPIGYEITDPVTQESATGTVFFDWKQRQAFMNAKREQEETQQPKAVDLIFDDPTSEESVWDYLVPEPASDDHPWITEKPPDTVDSETLAQYGLRIITDKSEDVPQLYIREAAFQSSGILEALSLLNAEVATKDKVGMDIFVINSPLCWPSHLTQEQSALLPESFKQKLATHETKQTQYIDGFRNAWIEENTKNIDIFKQKRQELIGKALPDSDVDTAIANLSDSILECEQSNIFLSSLTPVELFFRYSEEIFQAYENIEWLWGMHFGLEAGFGRSVITVPAGDAHVKVKNKVLFSYTADGTIAISKESNVLRSGELAKQSGLPSVANSYPRRKDFVENEKATYENNSYPFGIQQMGQGLRHEIVHAWFKDWLPKLKKRGLLDRMTWFNMLLHDTNMRWSVHFPDRNEWLTDQLAMMTIKQAEKYIERYQDNTMYSLVFSIPKNKNTPDGGYMITENQADEKPEHV